MQSYCARVTGTAACAGSSPSIVARSMPERESSGGGKTSASARTAPTASTATRKERRQGLPATVRNAHGFNVEKPITLLYLRRALRLSARRQPLG